MDVAKEILKPIYMITNSGIDAYDNLKRLEIEGKTESEEFKNTLERLSSSVFLEDNLYDKLGEDIGILTKLLASITMLALAWDLDVDLLLAKENHNIDLINRRIALRLLDKINKSNKKTPLSEIVTNVQDCSTENTIKFTKLSIAIRNDIINTLLMLLNIQIETIQNLEVKNRLIEFKYNIGILFQFVESDFINHNFAINPNLYWFSTAIADIEKIDYHFVGSYQKCYASRIERPIRELLETKNEDLNREDIYFEALLSQILIRVKLLFGKELAEKEIQKVIAKNHKKTDSAINMIKDAFEMRLADKEIPQIVSLNL